MFCSQCGNRASEGDRFCPACGSPLAVIAAPAESPTANSFQSEAPAVPTAPAWPWARLLARLIDLQVEASVLVFALGLAAPAYFLSIDKALSGNAFAWGFVTLPFAMLLDSALMAALGTTVGKALAGVRVEYRGDRLSFAQCLTRNIDVYIRGLALGIPLVNLLTMALAARSLRLGRLTAWDQRGGYRVSGARLPWYRWLLLMAIWLGLIVGGAFLNKLGRSVPEVASASRVPTSGVDDFERDLAEARRIMSDTWNSSAAEIVSGSDPSRGSSASLTWRNPVTGREVMLPPGWKETKMGIAGAFGFMDKAENHLVILAHEDVSFDIPAPPGPFLERYIDALEKTNKNWGQPTMRDIGIDGNHGRFGMETTRGGWYTGVDLNGTRANLYVEVWTFGGRKVWRTVVVRPAGLPESPEATHLAKMLPATTAPKGY